MVVSLEFGMSSFHFNFGMFISNATESSKMILSFPSFRIPRFFKFFLFFYFLIV